MALGLIGAGIIIETIMLIKLITFFLFICLSIFIVLLMHNKECKELIKYSQDEDFKKDLINDLNFLINDVEGSGRKVFLNYYSFGDVERELGVKMKISNLLGSEAIIRFVANENNKKRFYIGYDYRNIMEIDIYLNESMKRFEINDIDVSCR